MAGEQYPRLPPRLRDWEELNRRTSELSGNVLSRLDAMDTLLGDPNTPTEVRGSPLTLAGVPVLVDVGTELTDDYYVLVGPSQQIPDGRYFSPLVLGPRYVPQVTETFSETTDYDLLLGTAAVLNNSTLVNTYAAGNTSFSYRVTILEESTNSASDITVEVWGNIAADAGAWTLYESDTFFMNSLARQDVDRSYPLDFALAPGDMVELRVSADPGSPQARPWVRGSLRPSTIEVRQG